MTVKDPTPHEVEALRVADMIDSHGLWATAKLLRSRIGCHGVNDDAELRSVLLQVGRSEQQVCESIAAVHAAIDAHDAATGEGG